MRAAYLQPVRDDLYDVANRLKEIDPRYEVFYNVKSHRYEVHASGVLQIAVPFEELDVRTVEHVRRTRVENRRRLLEEMERENLAAEARAENAAAEALLCAASKEGLC